MKFNIAVAQFKINQITSGDNLLRAEKLVKKAASLEAGIIVFPEVFVDGPSLDNLDRFDTKGRYKKYFQSIAEKYKIDIVAGSIIEKEKQKLYNTSYYIDFKGKILARYKKIHLWHTEKPYISAGSKLAVFNTRFGKVGLMICWDIFFPDMFRGMVRKGAQIVFCPSYWRYEDAGVGIKYDKNSEIKLIDSICTARAFENEIIFIYASAAGRMKVGGLMDSLTGHSQIAIPFKGCIKKLEHNKEEMFIQKVDTDILKDAERVYKIREHLKK